MAKAKAASSLSLLHFTSFGSRLVVALSVCSCCESSEPGLTHFSPSGSACIDHQPPASSLNPSPKSSSSYSPSMPQPQLPVELLAKITKEGYAATDVKEVCRTCSAFCLAFKTFAWSLGGASTVRAP
jgi:hypothetical protein